MTEHGWNDRDDPFEGLVLDEDFVLAARKREPSAEDRLTRAASLRAAIDGAAERERRDGHPVRRARRAIGSSPVRRRGGLLLVVVLVVGLVVWWEMSRSDSFDWQGGDPMFSLLDQSNRPEPAPRVSEVPLGVPDERPAQSGPYRFLMTQSGDARPVAYDPCRPITVVVNERTMPTPATGVVDEAINAVSAITGFRFTMEGSTNEAPGEQRNAYQPDRYGERWAPVLISWTDPAESPGLGGNVAGLGGSVAVGSRDTTDGRDAELVYVTGIVQLDGPDLTRILERPDGRSHARAIVMHELGHLLGLDHVDDPAQLMYESNLGQVDFADGDLTGLHELSVGRCFDEL